ncbi:MAG: cell division protein ZapA [Flavobacteriaceae bacterium]|nr:cell division protein ZapA [Flavobacteriaceae bacterium]
MNDKLKIKIPIANRVYPMIIEPSKEQGLRLASQKINNLIKKFEQNYSVQDKQDALAMCALQIASSRIQKKIDNDETLDTIEMKINNLIDIFEKNI